MTDHIMAPAVPGGARLASRFLTFSAQFWFIVAAIGQWVFVFYVLYHYGTLAAAGTPEASKQAGMIVGDGLGNGLLFMHLALAVLIIGGGTLQLVPQIRDRFRAFHRWMGRTYITGSIATSLGGMYLIWTRDIPGGDLLAWAITGDGVLIMLFGVLAWKTALQKRYAAHRRWALRLFMVVSAVWFFRIGFMGWMMAMGGPVGVDTATLTGPFITFLAFGQYLVPLAFLELYFRAQQAGPAARYVMAGTLTILALMTAFGTFGAALGMWFPRMM